MVNGILILFTALVGWFLLLYLLERRGILERLGMSLMGPFLMLKTTRGRAFIERISRWRGVHLTGQAFVFLVIITMVGMTALLAWTATLVQAIPEGQEPAPQALLGLPGVNPFIPLTYGVFALAIAIIVHEFSHGVLARRWKVKIKSLGLLLFIVPIGAFVEPEEEELKALDKGKRRTVYAAGPGSNVVLAVAMAVLFSLGMMTAVTLKPVMGVTSVTPESPAESVGLAPGAVILSLNGEPIYGPDEFHDLLQATEAGQTVTLEVIQEGSPRTLTVTLADRADFTKKERDRGVGFLGVLPPPDPTIFNPLESRKTLGLGTALFLYIILPFQGFSPVQAPVTDFYQVTGAWGLIPTPLFWILANAFYWLFWINLMLGMTNALPAVPLDGGYMVRDWLEAAIKRFRASMRAEESERVARNVSYLIALVILGLILWQLIGPRI